MADGSMHPQFAEWYRTVTMADQSEIDVRWKGIVAAAAEISVAQIEELVRIAFETKRQASAEFTEKLIAMLRSSGGDLDGASDRAVQVLASAMLVKLFESSPAAALRIVTAACEGARKPRLPMDLVGLAKNDLDEWSASNEVRPTFTRRQAIAVDFKVSREQLDEDSGDLDAFDRLRKSFERVSTALNTRINELSTTVETHLAKTDEELQMLWWLIGRRSIELDLPFEKIEAANKPLVFSKELAGYTSAVPGPLGVSALLSRAGIKATGKLTVTDVANSMDDDWVAEAVPEDASPVTAPIHHALFRRGETGSGNAWVAGWSAVTGISEDHSTSPLKLAMLFYRERLLLNFASG